MINMDATGSVNDRTSRRKRWQRVGRFLTEAGRRPVSSPTGRALLLRVAGSATAVVALATGHFYDLFNETTARDAFIEAHNLPLSPPDPMPALVCGVLAAGVTLLFAGATLEIATGKRIAELLCSAGVQFQELIKSTGARLEGGSAMAAGPGRSAPDPAGEAVVQT